MSKGIIISLCDLTGAMVEPWVDNGYSAILVDPQHGETHQDGAVLKVAGTILEAMPVISDAIRSRRVVFVSGFPPCTDLAVSGARWFKEKAVEDKHFQAKAAMVAEQCRMVGMASGSPWFLENPVSVLSSILGKPQHTFNPYDYSGLCSDDNYTKKTCLWSGGGFIQPGKARNVELGEPDNRIHAAPPGPNRANFRSATPRGFAKAVYLANAPHLIGVAP